MSAAIETDVLIVGSGPAGSSAALFLSTHGIEKGTPQHLMGQTSFCTSMAGEELARSHTWGTHPDRLADYTLASPMAHLDVPQNLMAPILLGRAAERGTRVRLDTEYLELEQDDDGVTATVQDRISGSTYQVRAKYLIGADGGRSKVFADLGLPSEGRMDVAGSMDIVLHADPTRYVPHRPSVPYWVLQPGADIGGLGLVRMVRPWTEWLIFRGYDINEPPPQIGEDEAIRIAHNLIGDDTVPVRIRSTSLWGNNKWYARKVSDGRVLCMGDACHRHPPSNGPGSDTSIQDAYNLAWKLALVLKGRPTRRCWSPTTPSARPWQADRHARQQVDRGVRADLRRARPARHERPGAHARAHGGPQGGHAGGRRAAREAAQGDRAGEPRVQRARRRDEPRYRSDAVVPDGTDEPAWGRDPEGYYDPTTWPGARLPHVWLEHEGEKVSSLDLAGKGRFTLLSGIGGDAWTHGAAEVSARTGVEIASFVIGPGREVLDTDDDPAAELARVMEQILGFVTATAADGVAVVG